MRLKLTTALAWTTFALTACPVGAPQVDGANITCAKDSDCLAGEVCDPTYELCIAGPSTDGGPSVCVINGQTLDAGAINPSSPCQTCQPAVSTTVFSPLSGLTTGCPAGDVCENGSCTEGCYFPGSTPAFVPANAINAGNPCQVCTPSVSVSAWQMLNGTPSDAGTCPGGNICVAGACASGCLIDGGVVAEGTFETGAGCQACEPATSATSWSPATGVPPTGVCASGQVCNAGSCSAGCYVGGTFEAPGPNPASSCQSCVPSSLLSGWTDAADGTACSGNGGHFCQSGVCADLCDIGGQLFNNGAANPANGCQACEVANSDTSFSSVTGAVTCNTGGGDYCVAGTCSSACAVGTTVVASGTPEQSNPCQTCQPDVSKSAYSSLPNGTACDAGGGTFCSSGNCVAQCFVFDAGLLASGALDPADPNECCVPMASAMGWTAGFALGSTVPTAFAGQGTAFDAQLGDAGVLAVAEPNANQVELFSGTGTGTFSSGEVVSLPSGSGPIAVVLTDFNGDQLVDIAVLNGGAANVAVFLNQGDGGFAPAPSSPFAVGPSPSAIAVGNFKTKTSVDIAVTDQGVVGATGNEVSILLNNGNGSFAVAKAYQVGNTPMALAMADYDGDGFGDLAVANQADGTVSVISNNGNGTFTAPVTLGLDGGSPQPNAIVATDLNGDGKYDLAVASNVTNDVRVFLNGSGSWSGAQGPFAVGTNPTSLVAGNFNGNAVSGLNDLAVTNKTTGTVSVLINKTSTTSPQTALFWPQATYPLNGGLVSIAAGLFNADALPDLAIVNSTQKTVSILLGQCP